MTSAITVPVAPAAPAKGPTASHRMLPPLAWALGIVGLLIATATAVLVVMNRSVIHSIQDADPIELAISIGFTTLGALLASRRPRNPVGWIALALAIGDGVAGFDTQYVLHHTRIHHLLGAVWVGWTQPLVYFLVFPAGLVVFFLVLFPDGRLPSPRWRGLVWLAVVWTAGSFALAVVERTFTVTGSPALRNPIGISSIPDTNGTNWLANVIYAGGFAILVAAVVALIVRRRRATGRLRQQLRWLTDAVAVSAFVLVVVFVANTVSPNIPQGWWDVPGAIGFGIAVPVACGIAIFQHGLFDLDVVISKTVAYSVLAAFFTAVYLAIVVGIGTAVGSTHNAVLTVLAAALIALAFNPVRERAKHLANRVVFGNRATPYEVLSEFAGRMSETYAVEDVLPRMARILGEGTGSRHVGAELRRAASWGEGEAVRSSAAVVDGDVPAFPGASRVAPVRDRGELLGVLVVTKPPNEPLSEPEAKLVDDLASQAGLVLRNVRLTEELRANLEELRASRQRIVAAQDQERRRLERNIHDGAQQQLVALAVKLRLADTLVGRDEAKAHDLLAQLQSETQDALENLRDLARGIYPPLLSDKGLAAALDAQARKSVVPVTIDADGIGRYPQEQEAAVYFCVLEALQNVAKYASADTATVRLRQDDGILTFEVVDDGAGFDPSQTRHGTGMQGMADRLAALSGGLSISSSPGAGTTVRGEIPVKPDPAPAPVSA
jgi:signal transduction histidine kinase